MSEDFLLQELLPEQYNYKVVVFNVKEQSEQNIKCDIEVRVDVKTVPGVKTFLGDLNTSTGCTFNIQSVRPDRQGKGINPRCQYRGYRKCCMNVAQSENKENRQPGKNTNCEAGLNFRLENPIAKEDTMKHDRAEFPLWVKIYFHHNHSLRRAEYLKCMSVSLATKNVYTDMFIDGLTPGAAHAERRRQIKAEYPDTWPEVFADRSQLPGWFWVYYWHRIYLDSTVGSRDGLDAFEKAEALVKQFDEECKTEFPLGDGEYYARIAQSPRGETVVVICNPFMHRLHSTVPQASEIVMMDATSNLDRLDSKLFHFMCPSTVGALPLAEMITTREDEDTIKFGLACLKSVLPPGAFYGRGRDMGPQVFMTDDCLAERNALSCAWPHSVLLLCIFHVLKAVWAWLWDSKHNIAAPDRVLLINLFRQVLYAENEADLSDRLEEMYADPTVLKYPQFQKHLIKDTFPKMKAWSLSRRIADHLPTSNQNTNNIVESSFKYTKDIQFNRLKAFNIVDMLSLVLDKSEFYAHKCVDAANNVIKSWLRNCHSRYVFKTPNIDPDKIEQISPNCYLVPSESSEHVSYIVDMKMRTCSCPQGRLCGPCKHKNVLSHSRNIPSFDVIPEASPQMRKLFMFIGTGKMMALEYFLPLKEPSMEEDITSNKEINNNVTMDVLRNEEMVVEEDISEIISRDEVKEKLRKVLKKLEDKIGVRVEHDVSGYDRSLDILEKTIDRLPSSVDSALQKTLCSFGKTVTQVWFKCADAKYLKHNYSIGIFFTQEEEHWSDPNPVNC